MKGGGRQREGAIKNTAGKLKDEGLSTQPSGRGERPSPRVTALASILLILQNSLRVVRIQPASPEPLGEARVAVINFRNQPIVLIETKKCLVNFLVAPTRLLNESLRIYCVSWPLSITPSPV
jgi:hypothetical protein